MENDSVRNFSDDCGVVKKYLPNEPIIVIKGAEENFKITHAQDIYLAENLIKDGVFSSESYDLDNYSIKDKVVILFGASSGIGNDIKNKMTERGAKVYGFSRSLNGININNVKDVKKVFLDIFDKEKVIDIVINSTGLLSRVPLLSMEDDEIVNSINTNYLSIINLSRISFPYLKLSKGMLVNFTSSSYTRGRANYSIYSSCKAAVSNFTQALAEEWIEYGIKVNAINPSRTLTPMRLKNFGTEPADSLLSSDEVAEFTISCICSGQTGQIFSIKK